MSEQSMEGTTTPQEVVPTPEVQPAAVTPPVSQDNNVDVYRKLQSERDRLAAEAQRLAREKEEAEQLLNQKLTADEQNQRLIQMRNRALEEQLQQTQAEAERIKAANARQKLLETEFSDLKSLSPAVLDSIQGDEDTMRVSFSNIKKELDNYVKARTGAEKKLESAESQSPAVDNIVEQNASLSPDEFAKLPKAQRKSFIARMMGGTSVADMKFE